MEKLKAKLLAFSSADIQIYSKGKKRLQKLFHHERVEYVDQDPEILVFLTGGSERLALQSVRENGFYLLLASSTDNSWAAATEVKAWMNQNKISSHLIDYTTPKAIDLIDNFYNVKNGLRKLKGQRFGLIGEPSDWLVNSNIDPFLIKTKLGVEQIDIPWSKILINKQVTIAPEFMAFFNSDNQKALSEAGMIYEALSGIITEYGLKGITTECFSLILTHKSTACLALSKLSMDGVPSGCEGDTCSLLGMMLVKSIFGFVPWIANVSHVDENRILFSHCTAPANLYRGFEVVTHFESGIGLALKGSIKANEITILRLDHTLNRIFFGVGSVIEAPYQKTSCRTQLTASVPEKVSNYFISNPLGNHHLIIPGNYEVGLDLIALMLGMTKVV